MTHQQQIYLERESERQRQMDATMARGTVRAGSSVDGRTNGVHSRDMSGRYCYVQLHTSADTRALIAELLEVERLQRIAECAADECPDTERSTPRSKSEPPHVDRDDEIRGTI